MHYFFTIDGSGNIVGNGVSPDGSMPVGSTECTQDQYANASSLCVIGGAIQPIPAAQSLIHAQAQAIAAIGSAYTAAISTPVVYKSKAGVSETYQADPGSISNLQNMLLAFGATQTLPTGFYWVAQDNTQVPFVYADLQGLAQVIGTQGSAAFAQLQTLKAQVNAATTASGALAVVWPKS